MEQITCIDGKESTKKGTHAKWEYGISALGSYNAFKVIRPLPVQSGIAAPFYGQPGGGVQYFSPLNTQQLINQGYIIRIKF